LAFRWRRFATWLCATAFVATLRIASAQEPPKNFIFVNKAAPVREVTFDDAEGHTRKLADFKGKVLLVNIWATWCVPCRKEMPALDRLQARTLLAAFQPSRTLMARQKTVRKGGQRESSPRFSKAAFDDSPSYVFGACGRFYWHTHDVPFGPPK
jgi:thiol-disulfide isomerase/thioredoxin